jgi:beta-lactamase class A
MEGAMGRDWAPVEQAVAAAEAAGTVGVALIGPDGDVWSHRETRRFRAASVVKIPLMVEVHRQVERGALRLDDPHVLTASDRAEGSGVLLHLHEGLVLTVADLLYLTMSISDNTATNILLRKVGLEPVRATMRALGMTASTLEREMKGRPGQGQEGENWATPADYAEAVRRILDGAAGEPDSTEAMVTLLVRQQNPRRIARHLPEGQGIRWGSKTGGLTGVTNDVGFVEGPGGRLILAVFCEGMADLHAGERWIGAIARAALEATGVLVPRGPASGSGGPP